MRLQAFGPYDLIERVGVGSMGEVFRATVRATGREVALKRLMPFVAADPEVVEALHAEANLARALDHRCIAKVVDVGEVQGTHYIAYEYVHGRDLRALIERVHKRGERVPLDVAIRVVSEVALALAHAHARSDAAGRPLGLVHRDVCPSNILVAFDGGVKLADFGIALAGRDARPSGETSEGRVGRTAAGHVKGTIGYISPEQLDGGPVDGRSDLYALAVCLWELLTGARIFEGVPALVVMERMAKGDVPAPRSVVPELPAELDALVVKSLAAAPGGRYPGAEEFNDDLTRLAQRLGEVADSTRVAQYVRNVFPEAAADRAAPVPDGARGAGPWQECLTMADSKGGSDLDVFEGLSKKSPRSVPPGLTPPPPSAGPRQRTLVGGLTGGLPPPPTSTSTPLPPPSMPRPPTSAKSPASSAAPLPPPTSMRGSTVPLPPPPSGRVSGLPQVAPPPRNSAIPASVSNVGSLPPPTITPMRPPAALPPPSMPRPSTATPLPPPPGTLRPNDQAVPPPADKSLASALGVDGKKAGAKGSVDMDWDDEEESTHVYDKQQHGDVSPKGVRPAAGTPAAPKVSAAAALLASSGGAAKTGAPMSQPPNTMPTGMPHSGPMPMAPPPMSAHPQMPPMPSAPAPYVPAQPSSRDEPTSLRVRPQPSSGGSKAGLVLGIIALLAVIGMAVFMFFPRSGQFKIDIKSKGGAPVAKAEIFIDGQKKCDTAPCVVSELSPGPKVIKVIAPDATPTDMTETVEAGKEKLVLITIEGGATASTGGTGFKAAGNQPGVKVLVDGADKGALPVELKDLSPGSHKVRFEGDRYAPKEETIEVVAGQMKELPPVQLKVLKGTLTIELATAGASVTLTGQGAKKEKKTLDSVLKAGTPVKLSDIDATQTWKLHATKKGLADFDQDVSFEDGQPEKSIRIELVEPGKPQAAAVAAAPRGPGPAAAAPKEPAEPKTPDAAPAAAGGSGTLNINSIPVSKVVLDGRPLGSTPKVGVSVPAGNHTVTFIHPELGKKSVTVAVKSGETKTAAVKFK